MQVASAKAAMDDEGEDEDVDADTKKALAKYKMIDARLRRLCERKPSGKINVPEAIHKQWKAGGPQRDELRVLLEQYEFDKARDNQDKVGPL